MKKAEKKNWFTLALCVLAILAVLVIVSLFVPIYGEICSKNEYTGQKECPPYHLVLVWGWHVIEVLNAGGVAITALATLAIGAFTYQLKSALSDLLTPLFNLE